MMSTFIGIEDKDVIALARLTLKRSNLLGLDCTTRAQAEAILRVSLPGKSKWKPPVRGDGICWRCKGVIRVGDLCKTQGTDGTDEHIRCSDCWMDEILGGRNSGRTKWIK